jgi:hypothetical protein
VPGVRYEWSQRNWRSVESLESEAVRRRRTGRLDWRMRRGRSYLLLRQMVFEGLARYICRFSQPLDERPAVLMQDPAEAA